MCVFTIDKNFNVSTREEQILSGNIWFIGPQFSRLQFQSR